MHCLIFFHGASLHRYVNWGQQAFASYRPRCLLIIHAVEIKPLRRGGDPRAASVAPFQNYRNRPGAQSPSPQFVGNARVEYDQRKALEGADFVYAKNWAAYAEQTVWK